LGLQRPKSPEDAVSMTLRERVLLERRGLGLASGSTQAVEPTPLLEQSLQVQGLLGLDGIACAASNVRLLQRALDAGDARVAVMALQVEAGSRTAEVGDPRTVPALLKRAQDLIATLGDPTLAALQRFHVGYYDSFGRQNGDVRLALAHFQHFLDFVRATPQRFGAHDRASAEFHVAYGLYRTGQFSEAARELDAMVDDAWRRNDLQTIPVLVGGPIAAWLAVGEMTGAEQALARAERSWSALENPYTHLDTWLAFGRSHLCHARGDHQAAWELWTAHDRRFTTSPVSGAWAYASIVHFLRSMSAAAHAHHVVGSVEQAGLLREAEKPMRQDACAGDVAHGWSCLPLAAAACVRGDTQRAVAVLRQFDAAPKPPAFAPIYTHATRRRLGMLLGGDEGRALVAEADTFLRAGGAGDPASLVAMLLPGLGTSS
jgi:hypothetical protein